jgi:hypothetical protein
MGLFTDSASIGAIIKIAIIGGILLFGLPLIVGLPTPAIVIAVIVLIFWLLKR